MSWVNRDEEVDDVTLLVIVRSDMRVLAPWQWSGCLREDVVVCWWVGDLRGRGGGGGGMIGGMLGCWGE